MKFAIVSLAIVSSASAQMTAWGQCGGTGYAGSSACVSGYYCLYLNPYYSQCKPGTAATSSTLVTAASETTSSGSSTTPASAAASTADTKVQYAGINIAGFDFGCTTDGTCDLSDTDDVSVLGTTQMNHFVTQDGLNAFRLPVAWQYLVASDLGGTLDASNFATYNALVQGCIDSGAVFCIVDIHNYARWDGGIIGQGGPTNAEFASLWTQLATKYAGSSQIVFGLMNEPHDLDIDTWAATVQYVVTEIRAIAPDNRILLPGTDYTSAVDWISDGSGAALLGVTNTDGTTTNLVFDVHPYMDSEDTGTETSCVTNNVAGFDTLATWLRSEGRQAFLSETGGGSDSASCLTDVCEELEALNANADVFLGWTGWAAGGFDASYNLSLSPVGDVDVPLVTQCFAGLFK